MAVGCQLADRGRRNAGLEDGGEGNDGFPYNCPTHGKAGLVLGTPNCLISGQIGELGTSFA